MHIEELYEGAHEECGYYGTDTRDSRYFSDTSAPGNEHQSSENNTAHIGTDTYELELAYLPLIRHYQRNSVVCGNSEVGGYVQR